MVFSKILYDLLSFLNTWKKGNNKHAIQKWFLAVSFILRPGLALLKMAWVNKGASSGIGHKMIRIKQRGRVGKNLKFWSSFYNIKQLQFLDFKTSFLKYVFKFCLSVYVVHFLSPFKV